MEVYNAFHACSIHIFSTKAITTRQVSNPPVTICRIRKSPFWYMVIPMAMIANIPKASILPCLVWSTNGLYSKNSSVLPCQNTKGSIVSAKTMATTPRNRHCFFQPSFKKAYPYTTAKGMTATNRVESNKPASMPNAIVRLLKSTR